MTHSEQQAIESGDKVYLRKLMSLMPESNEPTDKMYDSDVLRVFNEETFKLSLPKEYGETVTLPLDMIYEIVIRTEDDIYRGQGRITERFRDPDGDVCIFQLTTSLSRDARKQYISCECKLPVRFCEQGGKEKRARNSDFDHDRQCRYDCFSVCRRRKQAEHGFYAGGQQRDCCGC